MTLRTRLTWAVGAMVAAVALLMGASAVQIAYLTGVQSIDRALQTVGEAAASAQSDALTATVYAASMQQQPVAVALMPMQGPLTWVVDGEGMRIARIALTDVGGKPTNIDVATGAYRVRSVKLSDGDSVVLLMDLASLQSERASNLRLVLLLSLLLALLGATASRWLVRVDLERIRGLTGVANRIASGDLQASIPPAVGVTEVDELSTSLDRMLGTLTTANQELQVSNRHLREFLGDVSHELRTPLTVVRGYVELLQSGEHLDSEVRARALQRSLGELDRMRELIADLLLLAEFDEQYEPAFEPVDLGAILREGLLDLMTQQPARRVRADLPDVSSTIPGDRRALMSLCTNLLGNVQRHTPEDAPVHVALSVRDGWCELVVEDGGPGLTDAQYAVDLDDLQRFTRMRSETTGGSGLGLRTIVTAVRMHGGHVRLYPSWLGGLRVECTFPVSAKAVEPMVASGDRQHRPSVPTLPEGR